MFSHLACGLDVPIHRAFHKDELEKLLTVQHLTHLFIGKEEYEENSVFFEKMKNQKTEVILVTDGTFALPVESTLKVFRKPFYSFALVNFLNAEKNGSEEEFQDRYMVCRNVRVLAVDDEPMNLLVAKEIFREYEMEVETAESGPDAIAACERKEYDLIFLDHLMPVMDGIECLHAVRSQIGGLNRNTPVVILTANVEMENQVLYRREGFDGYLPKPVSGMQLEAEKRYLF